MRKFTRLAADAMQWRQFFEWRRWFAWHPVRVSPTRAVWLKVVERRFDTRDRSTWRDGNPIRYEYRVPAAGVVGPQRVQAEERTHTDQHPRAFHPRAPSRTG